MFGTAQSCCDDPDKAWYCRHCGFDGGIGMKPGGPCGSCNGTGTTNGTPSECEHEGCEDGKIYYDCIHGFEDPHYYCPHSNNTTSAPHY